MEMVIDTLKYCDDLDDPAFAMYDVMKDAVEKGSPLSYRSLINGPSQHKITLTDTEITS